MRVTIAALIVLAGLTATPAPVSASADGGESRVAAVQGERAGGVDTLKARLVTLTNNRRVRHGCNRLATRAALGRAAQTHTRRLADWDETNGYTIGDERVYDPHQLDGEPALGQRVTNAGYSNWTLVGENVAYGFTTARAVLRAWMNSPGHRRNILKCRFKHIGIGLAYAQDGTPHWTQNFGRN